MEEIQDHNDYHTALSFYNFKDLPSSLEKLIEKRKVLINSITSNYTKKTKQTHENLHEWSIKIKQINDKYELIKSYMTNTFELNRQLKISSNKFNVQGKN